ncbi:hypothetical protein LCGC14_0712180 [marine sediment metagenome]|uniref:Uncharacterized protein n=1 Tax=marine sediment metagenome TaxID=412755 RepID=A0A0F9R033_9ZZZZ
MRGAGVGHLSGLVNIQMIYYILMRTLNQPYSEIKNIPLNDALFFINYENAIQDYIQQEMKKKGKR